MHIKELLSEVICGIAEADIHTPMSLDFITEDNDDFNCLTQIAHGSKENEFLKTFKGDGWNDNTKCLPHHEGDELCDISHVHCNNAVVLDTKCRYDTTNLNDKIYLTRDTDLPSQQENRTDKENNRDVTNAIRACLSDEGQNTMIDIQILRAENEKLYKHLMDSGANKGLTKHRHLLKAYRRIKKIPVGGIGENGAACYIIGVGYFDLKTADGFYIS